MEKISGVYKITNTITGDFYIGSSKDVKQRWANHKCPSALKKHPNNPLYKDMKKYGVDKFELQIVEEVEIDSLKEKEQQFIEKLKPTYNSNRAKGLDIERYKKYHKSDKCKDYQKQYLKEYCKSDKYKNIKKEYDKKYHKSDKYKDYQKQYQNKYNNQLCLYNGEIIKLNTLRMRFYKAGIKNPIKEAKKYILKKESNPIEFYDVYP